MTTTDEVYFLVRVGSWSESDLDHWADQRTLQALEEQQAELEAELKTAQELAHQEGFDAGYNAALKELAEHARYLER